MIRHSPRRSNLYSSTLVITRWSKNCSGYGGAINCHNTTHCDSGRVFIASPQAGSLNDSPLVSTAQAMRAFLAAMATTAFQ